MRRLGQPAALVVSAALAACSPDIATGAYLCGAEELCPESQVCNGADNTCVAPSTQVAFACTTVEEAREPDQDVGHAFSLGTLDCVAQPVIVNGCLAAGDHDDWIAFATRAECSTTAISLTILSPLAFEPVTVELGDATGAKLGEATAEACDRQASPDDTGTYALCLVQSLTPGQRYTLRVTPRGDADCGGTCGFNRYSLSTSAKLNP